MRVSLAFMALAMIMFPSASAAPTVSDVEWSLQDPESSRTGENQLTFVTAGDLDGWVARVSVIAHSGTQSLVVDHVSGAIGSAGVTPWALPFRTPPGRHDVDIRLVDLRTPDAAELAVASREVRQGYASFVGHGWGRTASASLDAVDLTGDGSADVILQESSSPWNLRVRDEAWNDASSHGWAMTFELTRDPSSPDGVVEFRVMGDTLRDVLHVNDPRDIRLLTPGVSMATRPSGELYLHVEPLVGAATTNVTIQTMNAGAAPVEPWRPGQQITHSGPSWDVDGNGEWDVRFWTVDAATTLSTAADPARVPDADRRGAPLSVSLGGNLSAWNAGQRFDFTVEDRDATRGTWMEIRRSGFLARMLPGATEVPFVIDTHDNPACTAVPGQPGTTWLWVMPEAGPENVTFATAPWRAQAATAGGQTSPQGGHSAADTGEAEPAKPRGTRGIPGPTSGATLVILVVLAVAGSARVRDGKRDP